jgi:PAS domain S-box-containing protein
MDTIDTIPILLVEDDQDQALLISHALRRHDSRFQLTVVGDAETCLASLAEHPCDLVLLDYRLPRTNGLELLREIRQLGFEVPSVILTAHGDEAIAVEAMKAGAADYIVKRGDYLSRLAPIVNQVLRHHRLEGRLALAQQRYQLLFESSRDAILILDSRDSLLDLNSRAELLLGSPREDAIGQALLEWIRPEQSEPLGDWLKELHAEKRVPNITLSFVNREGLLRWAEISAHWLEFSEDQGCYQLLLHDVAQERHDQEVWNALNRAALVAHQELTPEAIYRSVAHVLLGLGIASSMWWLDEQGQNLQLRYATYPQSAQADLQIETGLSAEHLQIAIARLALFEDRVMGGETVYVHDGQQLIRRIGAAADSNLIRWLTAVFDAGAVILLPFVIAEEPAGMVMLHGDLGPQSVPAARAFASQISSALEHARLYDDAQRRIRELAALQEISFKLSTTLELHSLMESITEVALDLTEANNCHIYLVGEDGFKFIVALRRDGSSDPLVDQPRADGLVARVARATQPLFIDDAKNHPLYRSPKARAWGVESVAGCPLLRGGQVLGVFTLTYLKPHHFDQAERHILTLLADQAAAAVETAQLYQDIRRRNDDLSTLYRVALAVSAQANISDVLETAYEAVYRATGARIFAVGMYNRTNDELVFKLISEEGRTASHANLPVSGGQGLMPWVARQRQELIIDDMSSATLPVPGVTVGAPVRSWMGFPLMAGEQLIGVMAVQSYEPHAFDEGAQGLCRGIATQLAIALEKARLLEEVQAQNWELSVLNKVAAAASHSFDLEMLLDESLSIVLQELRLDAGSFHIRDVESQLLRLVSQSNYPPQAARELIEVRPGRGLCGEVAQTGHPVIVRDLSAEPSRLSHALASYKLAVCIPLSSKDQVVGTLTLLSPDSRDLTPQELGLLTAVGRQIGVAVENAVLYRRAVARERRLARLNEAAHTLSSVLEARKLFHRMLETAVGELPVTAGVLWMRTDDSLLRRHMVLGAVPEGDDDVVPTAPAEIASVLQTEAGVLWQNRNDSRQWVGPEIVGKRGYRAAVPLRGQNTAIGVLEVRTASEEDRLTKSDVEFLSTLAGIAAIAYENAQLYEAVSQYAVSLEAKVDERTAEVRRQQEQTEAILRSVADAIFVVDDQSGIVLTNPAAAALLDASEHHSQRLHQFLHSLAKQPDSHAPGPSITLKGKTLQARAAKIRQEGVELGSVIVLRDVTHFEQINQLKSEFVSTVSHELRTPLSNLKLYLSLLERGKAEKREQYQKVLLQEVTRLENLIQDLLDLSRLETGGNLATKTSVNLWDIVSHVLMVLEPQAEAKQITLVSNGGVKRDVFWIQALREQMVQMLINLVANAINYTHSGGQVTLSLELRDDARGKWIIVSIQDTGVGIGPADMPRIFDRFYRGRVQQHMSPGTGLGLSIVKEILDRHEGWITVESDLGVGSRFTVGLPSCDPHDCPEAESSHEV